jgi:hypothetical protein
MIDTPNVGNGTEHRGRRKGSVIATIVAALVRAAERAGCSLRKHPMPELREVGREWRLSARS